ncbi:MAG: SMI1/KNR4 family protein [Oscillospiraceae bacterium]|jgi:hypothetical protein|nr:SMI1/KNR4 family protein [Oscillospiraceae bacterium]
MSEFVALLHSKPNFRAIIGASNEQINEAENALELQFSDEYHEYLAAFGVASVYGHEFTGICAFPRLNVVNVTSEARALEGNIPADWYVIEQAHIDGIVIWQSSAGEVYQTMPNALPTKLCDSLYEYLEL